MAKNFVARKWAKQKVQCIAPDVCLTQVGNSVVPLPYQISEELNKAKNTVKSVLFNGDEAFVKNSDSKSVKGDTKSGIKAGIASGTKGKQSDPLTYSRSVKVGGQPLLRVGDVMKMNNGNTVGKIKGTESGSAATITDDGEIKGETTSEEYKHTLDEQIKDNQALNEQAMGYAQQVWEGTQPKTPGAEQATDAEKKAFFNEFQQNPFAATMKQLKKSDTAPGDNIAEPLGIQVATLLIVAADEASSKKKSRSHIEQIKKANSSNGGGYNEWR